ncbi:MAG: hypothetical protein TREMPRED_005402 [Tremellales sp. Tagirdzhanova-0007]|nr:MAG: hypothetical protein TREMPRED_005402 [Tremellales sp. Tagirdzhanova-0007]
MDTMDSPKASYTVLRIKRKATEPPLSSLGQGPSRPLPSSHGTRLVVAPPNDPDSQAKKRRDVSGRARGVFRLAETVPDTWLGQGDEAAFLRERIKDLLAGREEVTSSIETESSPIPPPPLLPPPPPPRYQYRVVPPTSPRTRAMLPPRVLTIAETERDEKALVLVDALAVSTSSEPEPEPEPATRAREAEADGVNLGPGERDGGEEMAAFESMLSEYLSFERPSPPQPGHSQASAGSVRVSSQPKAERYVYDLYFRDLRPSLSSTPLGIGMGANLTIGALLGYQDLSPGSTPDASELEDEADEDSNDEDFYRNDYPEDEDADEDMRGYRDAFDEDGDDGLESDGGDDDDDDDGENTGERDVWDYR